MVVVALPAVLGEAAVDVVAAVAVVAVVLLRPWRFPFSNRPRWFNRSKSRLSRPSCSRLLRWPRLSLLFMLRKLRRLHRLRNSLHRPSSLRSRFSRSRMLRCSSRPSSNRNRLLSSSRAASSRRVWEAGRGARWALLLAGSRSRLSSTCRQIYTTTSGSRRG